jgi:transaldolase
MKDIRVNVTAIMSAQQCFLAAIAGATWVFFGRRVNNMGFNSCGEIARLRKLLDQSKTTAKIIIGSTREFLNITEWLEAGAHFLTVPPKIIERYDCSSLHKRSGPNVFARFRKN